MAEAQAAKLQINRKGTTAIVSLEGDWLPRSGLPELALVEKGLKEGSIKSLEFETSKLGRWDSGLLAFVGACSELCKNLRVEFNLDSLPEGVRKLIRLSQAVPEKEDARRQDEPGSLFHSVGEFAIQAQYGVHQAVRFIGETVLAGANLIRGKAQFRWPAAFV